MRAELNVERELLREINAAGAGAVLGSYAMYAKKFRCKVHAVRSAMLRLADQGVVQLKPRGKTIVLSPAPIEEDVALGFTERATKVYGASVDTRILALERRPLRIGKRFPYETAARDFLGLGDEDDAVIVIRLRLLDQKPRVIQRAYLSAERLGDSFLEDHNFRDESLMKIYVELGYAILKRNTMLSARFATREEMEILEIELKPVLESQQQTIAMHTATGKEVNLEFLAATYLDWSYRVERQSRSH